MTTENDCMASEIVLSYCLLFYEIEIKVMLVPIFLRNNSSKKVITCKFVEFFLLIYSSHCRDCNGSVQSIRLNYQRYEMSGSFILFFFCYKSIYNVFFNFSWCKNDNHIFQSVERHLMFWIFLQIDHIFLSRVCSETAGGLPGLYLHGSATMFYL